MRLELALELVASARERPSRAHVARATRFGMEVLAEARSLKFGGRIDDEARTLLDNVLALSLALAALEQD
jgi:hypothetical protein